MKMMVRIFLSVVLICTLSLSTKLHTPTYANDLATTCSYNATLQKNPDYATLNCLLTETALAYNIPPEIVKAIAELESGNWRHFDSNGEVIVTSDNGIGIMQITNKPEYDQVRLKNDIAYNIEIGVKTLSAMFDRKDLPTINDHNRSILEHWYFAVMAYNGTKPTNSPIIQATGARNLNAYQEKVIKNIEKFELLSFADLNFKKEDFEYDTTSTANIQFMKKRYTTNATLTASKYAFKKNDVLIITTEGTKLRAKPTTSTNNVISSLKKNEKITITGSFEYDRETTTTKNHFVWYPVKTSSGQTGYIASSYLIKPIDYSPYRQKFADFDESKWWVNDMIWAVERGLINGYGNVWNAKTKKYETLLKPNQQLTEEHFLTIFFRYAEKEELATIKNNTSWSLSGLYSLAKKYNMPVRASGTSSATQKLAKEGIQRGKIAQLIVSYHKGMEVSEKEAIQYFIANGLTTEPTESAYNAKGILKRDQISAFIRRYDTFLLNSN